MAWSPDKQSVYMKAYYAANKEKMLAKNKAYRERDPERHLARAREYHRKNREQLIERKRQHRKENPSIYAERLRLRKYGLSPDEFAAMVVAQHGRCAVCNDGGNLVVDHCHGTGRVRSLLCSPCNTALGLFKENPTVMRAAIKYLATK